MDFADPIKPQWVFKSESAGDWDVYRYSLKAMRAVNELTQFDEKDPIQGVKTLFREICERHASSEVDEANSAPTEDEIENLSQEDLQRFCREFIEHNPKLVADDANPPVKREDQSDATYLIEVLAADYKKDIDALKDTFEGLQSRLSGILQTQNVGLRSATQNLLKQNEGLAKVYSSRPDIFARTTALTVPRIPENPNNKMNNHFSEMNARLDRLIRFGESALQIMNGLQVAAAEFLDKFSQEAEKNNKAAKLAIFVGILAVILSVGQIVYTEFRRVPQDSAAMSAALASLRGDIDRLRTVLSSDLANAQSAQGEAFEAIASALGAADVTNTALIQSIHQLLRQQQQRDQAIIDALQAIASAGPRPSE